MSSDSRLVNLFNVPDRGPEFHIAGEARFVREVLGAQRIGMSHYRLKPGHRIGFGHRHVVAEEMYLVLAGTGRLKIDDEIVTARIHDVIYCPPEAMREWEAGSDGLEVLAFGAHAEEDNDGQRGWWID
jgi:uncharacterized cupin superfamily protein